MDSVMALDRNTSPIKKSSLNHQVLTQQLIDTEKIISILSHTIRNPLNAMKGAATLLGSKGSQDDRTNRLLDIIVDEVNRLDSIMNDLTVFSRETVLQKQISDLHVLIEDVLLSFKNQMDSSSIRVITNLDQSIPPVSVSPSKMSEALYCLIENSLEAMDGKGTLTVTTLSFKPSHHLVIRIQDTGHGITAEDMERLFEPLFSTKQKGYGFGLSIVSQAVIKHGGTIDVESLTDVGTTVSLKLPY
jgi:signal transduction histidine kinase